MLNVAASTPVQPDTPTDKQTIDSLRALQLHGLGLLAQRVRVCQCMCHRQVKQAMVEECNANIVHLANFSI